MFTPVTTLMISWYADAQHALTTSAFDLLILVIETKKQAALCHTFTLVWQRILTSSLIKNNYDYVAAQI